eukprot:2350737-Pleurochrysis_carterae.AAC.1
MFPVVLVLLSAAVSAAPLLALWAPAIVDGSALHDVPRPHSPCVVRRLGQAFSCAEHGRASA